MSTFRKLAGQTAIYGLSSIVGRLLNYFLVPLYTRVFVPAEYGVVNEMYAYVSFLIVILMYGMETAFFRYSELSENKNKVYSTTLISVLVSTSFFLILAILFAQPVADILRYPENSEYVVWFAMIISLDAVSSIPLARLRAQNRPRRFAVIKMANIFVNVGFNLFFLVLCPWLKTHGYAEGLLSVVYSENTGIGYIFISNLLASAVQMILLIPDFRGFKYVFDKILWRKMMKYALPLLIFGLAGIINETLDRILIKYMLPENVAMYQLGIYSACYKIAILMTIIIQAFRYAAEPFFFAQASQANAKEVYAKVMNYFIILLSFVFLSVMLFLDYVQYFIGAEYRIGLAVAPILLLANLCLGIFYNLSIWYKITNKTVYGAWIAIGGAAITIILNIILIPEIGYMGSAWATLVCYFGMMIVSWIIGQKHYPVNYNLIKAFAYIGSSIGLWLAASNIQMDNPIGGVAFRAFLLLLFAGLIWALEFRKHPIKPQS
ncbi:MAG: oligosaccharide flippase family protein [Bacteroidetes bacterium]|nr:oligosaccharide flippase family protein [Bacteroidota bacterium]